MTKRLLFIAFATMAGVAQAEQPVTIAQTIPYANDSVGDSDFRSQCDWNTQLSAMIVKAANGNIAATDKDLSQVQGRVLVLTITAIRSEGDGAFDASKFAVVHGELRDGSTVVGSYETSARTVSGAMSSCNGLLKVNRELAASIATWARTAADDPLVMIRSDDPAKVRQGARALYQQSGLDRATLDAVADRLSKGETAKDAVMVDGLAYLCRVLQKSGKARYRSFLQHVADAAEDSKLRKFAESALKTLADSPVDPYWSPAAAQ